MPKKLFILNDNGRHTLELIWGSFWRDFTIHYDGAAIDTIEGGGKKLRAGQQITLPDGSNLEIKLKNSLISSELAVLHNGRPLPGSATHPMQRVKQAYAIVLVIGALNLLLGIASFFYEAETLTLMDAGWMTAVLGAIWLILGWSIKEKHSLPALITALMLYIGDTILSLTAVINSGSAPGIGSLLVRTLFIIGMAQGIKAMRELRSKN